MQMTLEEISDRVIPVIKQCVPNCTEIIAERKNWGIPLTGCPFHLSSVELAYVLFEIEKEFSVRIPSELFRDYGFSTIEKICRIIQQL